MEMDILWHYRFPHDGWEYDCAVNALREQKPEGVVDPYTPNGVENPVLPGGDADTKWNHTMGETYRPTWFTLQEVSK